MLNLRSPMRQEKNYRLTEEVPYRTKKNKSLGSTTKKKAVIGDRFQNYAIETFISCIAE